MTPALPLGHEPFGPELEAEWRFRVIGERNLLLSMEMSFFTWNMEMSFFGMSLYIPDMCPENRDESNGNSIVKLWLQFIPIFGALHSQVRKGHTTKKDIPMFLICIASPQKGMR
jgi:hypothetical protein